MDSNATISGIGGKSTDERPEGEGERRERRLSVVEVDERSGGVGVGEHVVGVVGFEGGGID